MAATVGAGNEFQFAPLRPLDDFLLGSARFQLPSKDLQKWTNRMLSNLLWYQTNYLVIIAIVFALIGFMHPRDMLIGVGALTAASVVCYYAMTSSPAAVQFKKDHPIVCLLSIIAVGYGVVYFLGSVIVFLYGIALPMLVVFLHASLRIRTLKSKINEKLEAVGFKSSPMGRLFDIIGVEIDLVKFD